MALSGSGFEFEPGEVKGVIDPVFGGRVIMNRVNLNTAPPGEPVLETDLRVVIYRSNPYSRYGISGTAIKLLDYHPLDKSQVAQLAAVLDEQWVAAGQGSNSGNPYPVICSKDAATGHPGGVVIGEVGVITI